MVLNIYATFTSRIRHPSHRLRLVLMTAFADSVAVVVVDIGTRGMLSSAAVVVVVVAVADTANNKTDRTVAVSGTQAADRKHTDYYSATTPASKAVVAADIVLVME